MSSQSQPDTGIRVTDLQRAQLPLTGTEQVVMDQNGNTCTAPVSAITGTATGITQLTGEVTAGPGPGSQGASLSATGVVAGSYTNASIVVDAKGRIVAASNGIAQGITQMVGDVNAGPGSGVVAGTLVNTSVIPGSYTNTNLTVDSKGRITAASNGTGGGGGGSGMNQLTGDVTAGPGTGSQVATLATVNSNVGTFNAATITVNAKGLVTAASAVNAVTSLTGDVTAAGPGAAAATLANTAVTPGSYTAANITVDSKGRLTSAASSTAMTSLTGDVTATGPGAGAATLANTAVTPGSYTQANVTVDSKGRITAASNGQQTHPVNLQTGAYTLVTGDQNKLVTISSASPVGLTIPQGGSTGFPAGWSCQIESRGVGQVNLNPTVSTIDGAVSLALIQNQGVYLATDGTNWYTQRGAGGGMNQLTGDVTAGPGTGSQVSTLANTAVTAGSYVSPNLTVDAKGRITAASNATELINNQTGTSYTLVATDLKKLVTLSNASAIALTIPNAATAGFGNGWYCDLQNRGAGTLTATPASGTIDGAGSITLTTGMGCGLATDGTNWFTMRGFGQTGATGATGPQGPAGGSVANLPTTNLVAAWTSLSGLTKSGTTVTSWTDIQNGYVLNAVGSPSFSTTTNRVTLHLTEYFQSAVKVGGAGGLTANANAWTQCALVYMDSQATSGYPSIIGFDGTSTSGQISQILTNQNTGATTPNSGFIGQTDGVTGSYCNYPSPVSDSPAQPVLVALLLEAIPGGTSTLYTSHAPFSSFTALGTTSTTTVGPTGGNFFVGVYPPTPGGGSASVIEFQAIAIWNKTLTSGEKTSLLTWLQNPTGPSVTSVTLTSPDGSIVIQSGTGDSPSTPNKLLSVPSSAPPTDIAVLWGMPTGGTQGSFVYDSSSQSQINVWYDSANSPAVSASVGPYSGGGVPQPYSTYDSTNHMLVLNDQVEMIGSGLNIYTNSNGWSGFSVCWIGQASSIPTGQCSIVGLTSRSFIMLNGGPTPFNYWIRDFNSVYQYSAALPAGYNANTTFALMMVVNSAANAVALYGSLAPFTSWQGITGGAWSGASAGVAPEIHGLNNVGQANTYARGTLKTGMLVIYKHAIDATGAEGATVLKSLSAGVPVLPEIAALTGDLQSNQALVETFKAMIRSGSPVINTAFLPQLEAVPVSFPKATGSPTTDVVSSLNKACGKYGYISLIPGWQGAGLNVQPYGTGMAYYPGYSTQDTVADIAYSVSGTIILPGHGYLQSSQAAINALDFGNNPWGVNTLTNPLAVLSGYPYPFGAGQSCVYGAMSGLSVTGANYYSNNAKIIGVLWSQANTDRLYDISCFGCDISFIIEAYQYTECWSLKTQGEGTCGFLWSQPNWTSGGATDFSFGGQATAWMTANGAGNPRSGLGHIWMTGSSQQGLIGVWAKMWSKFSAGFGAMINDPSSPYPGNGVPVTASISGNILTVTAVTGNPILADSRPWWVYITEYPGCPPVLGTWIYSQLSGPSGGTGTYLLSWAIPGGVPSQSMLLVDIYINLYGSSPTPYGTALIKEGWAENTYGGRGGEGDTPAYTLNAPYVPGYWTGTTYSSGTIYALGDAVFSGGLIAISLANGNLNNAVPFQWDSTHSYSIGDQVWWPDFNTTRGLTWTSLTNSNLNNAPQIGSSFWQLAVNQWWGLAYQGGQAFPSYWWSNYTYPKGANINQVTLNGEMTQVFISTQANNLNHFPTTYPNPGAGSTYWIIGNVLRATVPTRYIQNAWMFIDNWQSAIFEDMEAYEDLIGFSFYITQAGSLTLKGGAYAPGVGGRNCPYAIRSLGGGTSYQNNLTLGYGSTSIYESLTKRPDGCPYQYNGVHSGAVLSSYELPTYAAEWAAYQSTPNGITPPSSGSAWTNPTNFPVKVVISGDTSTAVTLSGATIPLGQQHLGIVVPEGGTLTLTYSVAGTWSYYLPWGAVYSSINAAGVGITNRLAPKMSAPGGGLTGSNVTVTYPGDGGTNGVFDSTFGSNVGQVTFAVGAAPTTGYAYTPNLMGAGSGATTTFFTNVTTMASISLMYVTSGVLPLRFKVWLSSSVPWVIATSDSSSYAGPAGCDPTIDTDTHSYTTPASGSTIDTTSGYPGSDPYMGLGQGWQQFTVSGGSNVTLKGNDSGYVYSARGAGILANNFNTYTQGTGQTGTYAMGPFTGPRDTIPGHMLLTYTVAPTITWNWAQPLAITLPPNTWVTVQIIYNADRDGRLCIAPAGTVAGSSVVVRYAALGFVRGESVNRAIRNALWY